MSIDSHRRELLPPPYGFAIVTVSDSRDERSDRSGPRLAELVEGGGHRVVSRRIVPDEADRIAAAVGAALTAADVDVVLVTGGTGVAPRDVTVDAVASLIAVDLPGFGEIFRALSFAEIGPAAMLSRAAAGVTDGRALFLLPGSPAALDLALSRLILPEVGHLLAQARRADGPA